VWNESITAPQMSHSSDGISGSAASVDFQAFPSELGTLLRTDGSLNGGSPASMTKMQSRKRVTTKSTKNRNDLWSAEVSLKCNSA
jgi:hypothetical protein